MSKLAGLHKLGSWGRGLAIPIVLVLLGAINFAIAADSGQVVVATYGGTMLQALQKAYWEPLERETGIRVVVPGEPSVAKIKAMVDSGNVEWDLAEVTQLEMLAMQRQNLLERIDYTGFPKEEIDTILPEVVTPYGIGMTFIAQVVAYNTKAFPGDNHPKSWTDMWDVQHFPGPRSLSAMDRGIGPLEIPLLAEGVSPKNLYPLDVDRAFRALDKIRSSVPKWVTAGVEPGALLASGEAVLINASSARIISMRDQAGPVDFSLNQALLYSDVWVIPRGAKNYKNALRFLQLASSAKNQAQFSSIYPLAPVNRGAYRYLTSAQAAQLPTSPQSISSSIVVSSDWWAQTDASGKTNKEKVTERWRQWILQK